MCNNCASSLLKQWFYRQLVGCGSECKVGVFTLLGSYLAYLFIPWSEIRLFNLLCAGRNSRAFMFSVHCQCHKQCLCPTSPLPICHASSLLSLKWESVCPTSSPGSSTVFFSLFHVCVYTVSAAHCAALQSVAILFLHILVLPAFARVLSPLAAHSSPKPMQSMNYLGI